MARHIDIACDVDISQTARSFHAHAIPRGIDIRPGDQVLVHDIPAGIRFGDQLTLECRATLIRASWLRTMLTQACGLFALTELYEVGFAPREAS